MGTIVIKASKGWRTASFQSTWDIWNNKTLKLFKEHGCGEVANIRPEFFDDADAVRFHSTESRTD